MKEQGIRTAICLDSLFIGLLSVISYQLSVIRRNPTDLKLTPRCLDS
ncbi:hypothetical protein SAMN05421813_11334 [Daejeonella rubra]|uniref:Uncharacterized protein n=1 Tax=Daejeonella rubra TaxID=990371 RepID=A0A1G9TJ26_9SPHI|nr:hypothetical protein SAMN05421813_11334 [Daejeonella rubra]